LPAVRSSVLPFPVPLRQPARSYQAAFAICLAQLPSLNPQISWIRLELRKVMRSPLHLLLATARAFHFLLRQDSAILELAVLPARVKAVDPVAFQRPETEKEFRQTAAADSFAAHSSPEICRSFSARLPDSQTCLVTADLLIVFDPAAAGPDLVVAAGSVAVAAAVGSVVVLFAAALASGLACSACPVRFFSAVTGKVKAALAVFYFLVLRSSSLHNRSCPSLPCFAGRA